MSRFSAYAPTAHCAPSILSMVGLPSFIVGGVVVDIVGVIDVAGVVGVVVTPPAEVERS